MKVAVIGGGIAGLTAAIALRRTGHDVTVHERLEAFAPIGAGLQLGPNATAVLAALDVLDPVMAAASTPKTLGFHSAYGGRQVFDIALETGGAPRWGHPYVHIYRPSLITILAEEARARGVDFQFSSTTGAGDLVVRAEGIHGGREAATYSGYAAWRAVVPGKGLMERLSGARVWSGRGCHAVTYPLKAPQAINFVGVTPYEAPVPLSWTRTVSAAGALKAFRGFAPDVLRLVRQAGDLRCWGIHTRPLTRLSGGDPVIGDAAHAMVPFLAQGAGMAIEDAWAVAVAAETSGNVAQSLHAMRAARLAKVQEASRDAGRFYHQARLARRLGSFAALGAGQAIGGGVLARAFDWLYGYDITKAYPLQRAASPRRKGR